MNKHIDVSILTPVWQEPLWMIKRNIDSVKKQITKYTFEHMVVIDNPDISEEIQKFLLDSEVSFFMHKKNKGLSATRNTALRETMGEYIMLLDADDCFVPGRIEKQLNFMKEKNLDHCFGGFREIHGDGKPMEKEIIPPEFDISYLLDFNNICPCGSNCFKREIYEKLGGFDESMKEGAEDMEYIFRLARNGYRSGCLPEVLYYLGISNNNMTAKLIANGGFKRAYQYIREKYPNDKWTN